MKQKKVSGILRVLGGAYLSYLGYGLVENLNLKEFSKHIASGVFGILYLLIGVALMIWGGYGYYKGYKLEKENDQQEVK